jgi:hypothetical protein
MRQPRMMVGSNDCCEPRLHPGSRDLISTKLELCGRLSYVRPVVPRIQCVGLVFACRVYINSYHHDTLGYVWPLVCCCHLVICFDG